MFGLWKGGPLFHTHDINQDYQDSEVWKGKLVTGTIQRKCKLRLLSKL